MVRWQASIAGSSRLVLASVMALVAASCKPDLEGRPSLVDSPRVIAIRSTPAEGMPGSTVTYDVLVAKPVADTTELVLDWALCLAQNPLANSGSISDACLVRSSPKLTALGTASSVTATIPSDSCQRFGPTTPTQNPGEPPLRAVDPDTTGGFYQPVRLLSEFGDGPAEYEVGVTRLLCGIGSGVTQEQAATFATGYRANQSPRIEQVSAARANGEKATVDLSGATVATFSRGEALAFEVKWPSCSTEISCGDGLCSAGEDLDSCPSDCKTPKGCEGSEPYLSYDATTQSLVNRRESMRISWYATDGSFEHDRTGRLETEANKVTSANTWTAPNSPGLVRFWFVIRDDRRGANWVSFDVQVE